MKATHLQWTTNPMLPWGVENDDGVMIAQFENGADADLFIAAKDAAQPDVGRDQ